MRQILVLPAIALLSVAGAYSLDRPTDIRASILLEEPGGKGVRPGVREVGASESFYSGDRFQLKVHSPQSGYIYLLLENSSGEQQLLYPYAGSGHGINRVRANRPMTVPGKTWYKFDDNPGEEVVYVLISEIPIESLERAGKDKSATLDAETFHALVRQAESETQDDKGIDVQRDNGSRPQRQMSVLRLNLSHLP